MPSDSIEFPDDVSRETIELLDRFKSLVLKWNPVINLISKASEREIDRRHVADSLQLCRHAPPDAKRWCDLGSGGGFPAIVVAICYATSGRSLEMVCIESDARKATFLRESARQLDLNIIVRTERVEQAAPVMADVISARALASLPKLCEMSYRHMHSSSIAIFPKGANYQSELSGARENWTFDLEAASSRTEAASAILILRNLRHAG